MSGRLIHVSWPEHGFSFRIRVGISGPFQLTAHFVVSASVVQQPWYGRRSRIQLANGYGRMTWLAASSIVRLLALYPLHTGVLIVTVIKFIHLLGELSYPIVSQRTYHRQPFDG